VDVSLFAVLWVVCVGIMCGVYTILFLNPHEKSARKLLKEDGIVGIWRYSFGGWTNHYHVEHTIRYLPCDGGYLAMYKEKIRSPIFFIPDYYEIKEVTDGE